MMTKPQMYDDYMYDTNVTYDAYENAFQRFCFNFAELIV